MAAEKIGDAKCPLCGGRARLSLSSKGLPVLTMNCCNAQAFARSDRSDMLMRALLLPAEKPEQQAQDAPETANVPKVEETTAPPVKKPASWLSLIGDD